MRDFGLEDYFAKWKFTARYQMTASDLESMSMPDLLAMASDEDRAGFENQAMATKASRRLMLLNTLLDS